MMARLRPRPARRNAAPATITGAFAALGELHVALDPDQRRGARAVGVPEHRVLERSCGRASGSAARAEPRALRRATSGASRARGCAARRAGAATPATRRGSQPMRQRRVRRAQRPVAAQMDQPDAEPRPARASRRRSRSAAARRRAAPCSGCSPTGTACGHCADQLLPSPVDAAAQRRARASSGQRLRASGSDVHHDSRAPPGRRSPQTNSDVAPVCCTSRAASVIV